MKLSVIVPVYNVEKYVRPCMESIFRQGLDERDFEVIIVNDGSSDRSMEMISDIIRQHQNITVIQQENQSLSVARNNGIAVARGEYIIMPDSDDLLFENSLPVLLEKALETKVDLLVADFIKVLDGETDRIQVKNPPVAEFSMQIKSGEELFLEDLNPDECYVWHALYRREFLMENHITFVPRINYQDIPYTHECYLKAKRCIRTHWLLNIYRKGREGAATFRFSPKKAKSLTTALAHTWPLRDTEGLSPKVVYKLEENVFVIFRFLFYHSIYGIQGRADRNAIMDDLTAIPDFRFTHNVTQRAVSFLLRKMPHLFINLAYAFKHIK